MTRHNSPIESFAFLRNGAWLLCRMTVGIVRSQIIAFDIPHRLPSHAAEFVIHLQAAAPKDSQLVRRKEFW